MATQQELLARLRRKNAELRGEGGEVEEGLQQKEVFQRRAEQTLEEQFMEESIAMLRLRPVLPIKNDKIALEWQDDRDKQLWEASLTSSMKAINAVIPSVGRIELSGSRFSWVGTGWVVDDNILVTNRHVAQEFAEQSGGKFTFQAGIDVDAMSARTDFKNEIGNTSPPVLFELTKPLWIEAKPGPDVAFFEIEKVSGSATLAGPLKLSDMPTATSNVATIGYPAYDSRIPETQEMHRIFNFTYDKKRFAPGGIKRITETRVEHDCTTLGGNSGSVVVDLSTGEVIGLHFSGTYLDRNYAVRSDVVKKLLERVKNAKVSVSGFETRPRSRAGAAGVGGRARSGDAGGGRMQFSANAGGTASVTIPVTVTVSIGGATSRPKTPYRPQRPTTDEDDMDEGQEAAPEDYANRGGYDEKFLLDANDNPVSVAVPEVVRDSDDILQFKIKNTTESVLRYEHFSVVMSESRRMCFWSATNIDGNQAKKAKRVQWKWDPRIPKAQQIMKECYGNSPKFSRGHMTRREDPGWGTGAESKRGNEDSMHVTNACPQMQAFNSPIWLALEDHALQHAKEDKMRISVFTGPYFDENDPTMYGVRIPVAFWKVIAFIHDDIGKLCATGYEMDQQQSLEPAEEFVFGQFYSTHLNMATQVPIRAIEWRSGINFGRLASVDPLAAEEEGFGDGGARTPLHAIEEIRFF